MKILDIQNLDIAFKNEGSINKVVNQLNFGIEENSIVGLAGESGSGKSVTALSIIRLLDPNSTLTSGRIIWSANGLKTDLQKVSEKEIRSYRGAKISMIFQEPMSALNPVLTCGFQTSEALLAHQYGNNEKIKKRVLESYELAGLTDIERIYKSYPFELSGGQLQRVLIAMAISCNPQLIIADEPTTALDVNLQKHVIDLLKYLKQKLNLSILFISHDLSLIRDFCDSVVIMNQGNMVESGITQQIFNQPAHWYTKGLLSCRPPLKVKLNRLPTLADYVNSSENSTLSQSSTTKIPNVDNKNEIQGQPLISVTNLNVAYATRSGFFNSKPDYKVVHNVNIKINKGEVLGLVGASGSGKSTIGRSLLNLIPRQSGKIYFEQTDLSNLKNSQWRKYRKKMQIIFQDPYSSLNPRQSVGKALMEPMEVHELYENKNSRKEHAIFLLETVGLLADHFYRYPHQFSGGQRQRICIARALTMDPEFIVCDEPVSALDVSIQAQILNLLKDLKERLKLSYLFISHDLSVVHFISDRIAVIKAGEIIEEGNSEDIINNPKTEYTKSLIAAVPI
jgi:peptide/nickel transport system ATP-binding protein